MPAGTDHSRGDPNGRLGRGPAPGAEGVETTRAYAQGAGVVSLGVAATGLISYGYFSLASHSLAPAEYGRITLLWSAVFITVSILYRPVEQLLARSIAERDAHGTDGNRHLRVAGLIQAGLATAFALGALALRRPIEDGLFGGSSALFWIMVATVLAYAGGYFARGFLAGHRRFGSYGALLLLESSTRVTFAVAVAVGLASGASVVGLGMAVGPAVSLAVVGALAGRALRARRSVPAGAPYAAGPASAGAPSPVPSTPASRVPPSTSAARAVKPSSATPGARPAPSSPTPGVDEPVEAVRVADPELSLARGAGYASGVLVIMASEQAFLAAGPLVINATEPVVGAALAGFAFNALLIARAPLQLFQAVQASILPHLTRLRAGGHEDPFRRSVTLTLVAVAAFAAVVTAALLAVGPEVMTLLFGDGLEYARWGLALMGVAMGLYLAAATLTQAVLARGQAGRAAARWLAAAAGFVVLLVVPGPDDPVLQVEAAFAAGAFLLLVGMSTLYRRGDPNP